MSFTSYSQGAMAEGIDSLKRAHKTFTELIENLRSQLNNSLAEWEDSAREAYQIESNNWNQAANRQSDIINKMPVLLQNITDGYNATESMNTKRWNA